MQDLWDTSKRQSKAIEKLTDRVLDLEKVREAQMDHMVALTRLVEQVSRAISTVSNQH